MTLRKTLLFLGLLPFLLFQNSLSAQQAGKEYPKDPEGNVIIYPHLPQNKLPLGRDYVRMAAGVSLGFKHDTVDEYHAIFFHPDNWDAGQKDKLFGPFLSNQEKKDNRAAVIMFSSSEDEVICVYFQDEVPYGAVLIKAEIGHAFETKEIASAYKPVTAEMIVPYDKKLTFIKTLMPLDDGTMVKSFMIGEAHS